MNLNNESRPYNENSCELKYFPLDELLAKGNQLKTLSAIALKHSTLTEMQL